MARQSKYINLAHRNRNQKDYTYLHIRFACETDDHEEQDRNNVVIKTRPVIDFKGCYKRTHQHEEDRTRPQNRTTCFYN